MSQRRGSLHHEIFVDDDSCRRDNILFVLTEGEEKRYCRQTPHMRTASGDLETALSVDTPPCMMV